MPTSTSDLTNQYQRHFSRKLLEHAVQLLILDQFAKKEDLPRGIGAKTMRFFRKIEASRAAVVVLTEGVTPTERRKVTLVPVDVDLVQIGEIAEITDIVGMTALFNSLQQHIDTMGEDAALDADSRTRDELVPNITSAGQRRFSGGAADFTALGALSNEDGKFQSIDGLNACTQLKINRSPRISGHYVGIVSPHIIRDLRRDPAWLDASKYGATKQLFKDEVGMLDGIRYVEHTNPFIEDATLNTYDDGGDIYTSLFTGRDAYGCPKLAGTKSPWAPKVMISTGAQKSDPLDQIMTAGWKAFWAAKLLNEKFIVSVRSKSTFND